MKFVVSLFVCCVLFQAVLGELGNVTVSFFEEDPAEGGRADTILRLGESVIATLTLSPPPVLPIRFDIVSSLPEIIKVTHDRITFNRGQTQGDITLESPSDGKVGISTIIISPERPGLYRPITFDVLVQGNMVVAFANDQCVSVGVLASVMVMVYPPSPETIEVGLSVLNGELSSSEVSIPTGQTSVLFTFNGTSIDSSSITATTELYVSSTLNFETLGTIITSGPSRLIEDSPANFQVRVLPENPDDLPNIFVSAANAIVTPVSFTLMEDSQVEVIPEFFGISEVTYRANDYCPRVDKFDVDAALLCSTGFIPNILGDLCVECPGNSMSSSMGSIDCSGEGTCSYSKCFDDKAVCFCFFPYIGHACQFDMTDVSGDFDEAMLNSFQFELELNNLALTVAPTKFLAPGNLIDPELQPGRAVVAGYDPSNLFYNAINPRMNPPERAFFTGISWYWENSCYENALIDADFLTAPVSVRLYIAPNAFNDLELYQNELFYYNEDSEMWMSSVDVCRNAGFNSTFVVDYHKQTFTTSFCRPGQYAIYIVKNTPQVQNTGNTNPPNPTADQLSGTFPGTGRTGWQPAPPLPLPVEPDMDAFRGSLKITSSYHSSSSSILKASSVLLFTFLLMWV